MPPCGQRQTLMFSATFPKDIQRLAADFLNNYVFLTVGRVGSSTDLIVQHIEYVSPSDKQNTLLDLITSVSGPESVPVRSPHEVSDMYASAMPIRVEKCLFNHPSRLICKCS